MKIGEFAKKHNITQDTIRHYLELGLLVTEKNGGHYDFRENDSYDIIQIMELKNLNFSLNEIQRILTIQRVSGSNTNTFRNLYLSFLKDKNTEVENELTKFMKYNSLIKGKIHEIQSKKSNNEKNLGFPILSLQLLVCPKCGEDLNLSDGTIEENSIMDANFKCSCGYEAKIRNGVFINEDSMKTKLLNGEKMPSKEEYLASSSYEYNNFLYKGLNSLIGFVNKYSHEPDYIMELDNCVGFFLLQYIKYLPGKSTYILIDYDIERINKLKYDLENYYEHKNFIFLCCDYENLPIKTSSVDVMIDYNITKKYEDENGKELFSKVLPIMKEDGILASSFRFYKPNSIRSTAEKDEKYYNSNFYVEKMKNHNYKVLESSNVGPAAGECVFNMEITGAELFQSTYVCKKILG